MEAKFILSKNKVIEQFNILRDLGTVSYSWKTNPKVGQILEQNTDSMFSIHSIEELPNIRDTKRIWFFAQAWNQNEIKSLISKNITNFVVDNESDLTQLENFLNNNETKINLLLRMKLQERRIETGKYFVFGMTSKTINNNIEKLSTNNKINQLGIHVHRTSQNTSQWDLKEELEDSITKENLKKINIINIGGGFPIEYRNYTSKVNDYIFNKIKELNIWLKGQNIQLILEPGRFIAGPSIKLSTRIISTYDNNIIINCSVYQGNTDAIFQNALKLLVENELETGEEYTIKGKTPCSLDIFRYKVALPDLKVGDEIVFLNAGAYNFSTEFCGLNKLKTMVVEDFEENKLNFVSVPFAGGNLGKNLGCDKAPQIILENINHETLNVDNFNIVTTNKLLESSSGDFFIGGDHSITYSLFKGFIKNKNKEKTGLVIFDAHPDCVNNFSPPSHEDFIRTLIEKDILLPENLLIIGLRKIDDIEQKYLDEKGIKYILMEDIGMNLPSIINQFTNKFDSWYLSLDIDVLDPNEAPGTGYLEDNGMKLNYLLDTLKNINKTNLKRTDLVEVSPTKDIDNKTINAAKKILEVLS